MTTSTSLPDLDPPATPSPWLAGWRAAKANMVPGLVLQVIAILIVVVYYQHAPTRAALDVFARLKDQWGVPYAMIVTSLMAGLIPFLIQRLAPASGKPPAVKELPFRLLYWAYKGFEVDLLYKVQAGIFGNSTAVATVVAKVLADQLIYSPFIGNAGYLLVERWRNDGFRWASLKPPRGFWRQYLLPLQISAWAVWVPAVTVIYLLPLALQLQIQNVILVFWILIVTYMVREQQDGDATRVATGPGHGPAAPESAEPAPTRRGDA